MLKKFFILLVCLAAFSLGGFCVILFFTEDRKLFFFSALNRETKPEESAEPTVRPNPTESPGRSLDPCPDVPPNLRGVLHVEFRTNRTLQDVRNHVGPLIQQGGRYRPTSCRAKQKVAVIVPFRNRSQHLNHWLYYLHPVLMRQQLDYGVYVINQDGDGAFNRAKLMNIGFNESLKEYDYDCFVFSDVDLVPLDDRNLYRCSDHPRHLSVAVDKFNFILPYATIFGGVTALSKQQFLKVNGFSNTFWGWGGEDDDLSQRLSYRGMFISRPDSVTGRYKMIKHGRDSHNDPNPNSVQKLTETYLNMDTDGINSLSYTVREIRKDLLYTFVTVDVQAPAG
ncbi:PREDICTED: beta-1,4-galactosyltransferase 2-like [Poecilia mexicana]|uniref:Beta-1,4-galactosyltransferase n=1 Tax=Poecilia mexicana TaxID=48701 RepID=A0A3B3XR67_9TELE|nr:PREDICTED: beta-1,4-galactosyltransferase 2-like [Poecilia mexicana]